VIAVFDSTRSAILAERVCVAAGLSCQAIPVPRDISAGCGIALEMNEQERPKAEAVMLKEGLAPRFIGR
jgi:hypothetical protein